LARAIYERGQFDLDASLRVGYILAGYAPAIWAYSMTHVLTRAFYAMKDSRTPTVVSVMMVVLNLLLNLLLVVPFGTAGLAMSTAICAMLQCVILVLAIRNYVEHPVDASVLHGWGKVALLTALMATALLPVTYLFDPRALSHLAVFIQLCVMVGIGAAVIGVGAWVLKVDELRWLIRRGR
jgi:putative peptidoglycan lipid II flippase